MAMHEIYLRAFVPIYYAVNVEADSLEDAHAKVVEDVEKNGCDSDYWKDSESMDIDHDFAENIEVMDVDPDFAKDRKLAGLED